MNQQEALWSGDFGKAYIERNRGPEIAAAALQFIARCLTKAPGIRSVLELGANIGLNLDAVGRLYPEATQAAVEINPAACKALRKTDHREVHQSSILAFGHAGRHWDLVITKGVLIHIAPADLPRVYQTIDECARRYVLIAEYFNPTPIEVRYRGQEHAMWKRDFAAELMDQCDGWECVDYGFVWSRDPMPQDSITWFLLERR